MGSHEGSFSSFHRTRNYRPLLRPCSSLASLDSNIFLTSQLDICSPAPLRHLSLFVDSISWWQLTCYKLISLKLDHLQEVVPLHLLQPLSVPLEVLHLVHQAPRSSALLEVLQARLDQLQVLRQAILALLCEVVSGKGRPRVVFGLIERPAGVDVDLVERVVPLRLLEGLLERLHPVDELDLGHVDLVLLEEAVAVPVAPELPQENSALHPMRIHLHITSLTPSTSPTTLRFYFFQQLLKPIRQKVHFLSPTSSIVRKKSCSRFLLRSTLWLLVPMRPNLALVSVGSGSRAARDLAWASPVMAVLRLKPSLLSI